jgi:hypothetical protein
MHVEVVLLSWQQLPEELLSLSANWMYLESRFYRIAQVDMEGVLTIEMLEFLEHLKEQNHIADFCSRVIAREQGVFTKTIDLGEARYNELPEWVRP